MVVGPCGADFASFCLFFVGFWVLVGSSPRPLCGCGLLWGLILVILLVLGSFFGAGGGLALAPSVVVGPFGG